jgi:hypothetical protein
MTLKLKFLLGLLVTDIQDKATKGPDGAIIVGWIEVAKLETDAKAAIAITIFFI